MSDLQRTDAVQWQKSNCANYPGRRRCFGRWSEICSTSIHPITQGYGHWCIRHLRQAWSNKCVPALRPSPTSCSIVLCGRVRWIWSRTSRFHCQWQSSRKFWACQERTTISFTSGRRQWYHWLLPALRCALFRASGGLFVISATFSSCAGVILSMI